MAREVDGEPVRLLFLHLVQLEYARYDLAGVQSDPYGDRAPRLKRLLHGKRGLAGEQGVPLPRVRRAEDRHDTIPEGADYAAEVTLDGGAHRGDGGAQTVHRLLGVEPGDQPGRSDDVREQHSRLLALADG